MATLRRSLWVPLLLGSLAGPARATPPACAFDGLVVECWGRARESRLQPILDRAHEEGYVLTTLLTPDARGEGPGPVGLRFQRRGPEAGAIRYRVVVAGRGRERRITRRLNAAGADGFRLEPSLSAELEQPLPVLVEFARKRRVLLLQKPEAAQGTWQYLVIEEPHAGLVFSKSDEKERASYERRVRDATAAGFEWCPRAPWLLERHVTAGGS